MIDTTSSILLVTVAITWGVTNTLMKTSVDEVESCSSNTAPWYTNLWTELASLVKNWKYLCAYGANQMGSLLFYYSLGFCQLSIASPLVNVMTFVVTFLADQYFLSSDVKKPVSLAQKSGLLCVCSGIIVCIYASVS